MPKTMYFKEEFIGLLAKWNFIRAVCEAKALAEAIERNWYVIFAEPPLGSKEIQNIKDLCSDLLLELEGK